jgi:SAM-dependent methyltransferase
MSSYQGAGVLDVMSANAVNRNNAIAKLISKFIFGGLKSRATVVEFGAGKGEFIFRYINKADVKLIAIDSDESFIKILSEKVKTFQSLDEIKEPVDAIYLIDVLEHIQEDGKILEAFYQKLVPGGRLFIYVPARRELYSEFDKSIGHFRRYNMNELRDLVSNAGFRIKISRYHEVLGYFASAMNKLSGSSKLQPVAVKWYDSILVPASEFIERFIPVPFGKSIYLSASRS